ncbi:hypothetical protein [Leptospira interrogans]|nr:hypothetical protein [Leptospira interrogans]
MTYIYIPINKRMSGAKKVIAIEVISRLICRYSHNEEKYEKIAFTRVLN